MLNEANCQIEQAGMRAICDHERAHRVGACGLSDICDEKSRNTSTLPHRVDEQVFQFKLYGTAIVDRGEAHKAAVNEGDGGPGRLRRLSRRTEDGPDARAARLGVRHSTGTTRGIRAAG
jgi:hypothetical protein